MITTFLLLVHGATGIAGLLLIIEVVISGAMLARRIDKAEGTNIFKLHRRFAVLFCLSMLGSFSSGLWLTAGRGKPLLSSVHGWLGLAIIALSMLQLIPSLVVKTRTRIRQFHTILGYTLITLAVIQAVWGLHIAVLGAVKPLILIHSVSGGVAAFALTWIIIEMRHLTEPGIARAKLAAYAAAFFITMGSWLVGGYNYLANYGSKIKPLILAGPEPWAHRIIMEAKEHIFIFLPVIAFLLAGTLLAVGRDKALIGDLKSRRAVSLLASAALILVLLMFIMGAIISNAGRISLRGG